MKKESIDTDPRFQRLSGSNYAGMTFFDGDYNVIYRSPTSERLTGWPNEAFKNVPINEMVYPDDLGELMALLQEVRQTPGLSLTCTCRSRHYDGHGIWLQSTYTNMLNEPGIEAIICSFIDITLQKKAEEDYKVQSAQVNELLLTMTDGFLTLDENLCYTYVNPKVLKMVNKTEKELIGRHMWDVFPAAIGSSTWQAINTSVSEKKTVLNEDFYPPLQLWIENRIYPSGSGLSIFVRDITRQKTEENHHKFLESVIINTNDAIMITEAHPISKPGPRILYVNEAFTRMTGYTVGEVIGKTPRILQGPKTDKQELLRIKECLRTWQPCEASVVNYKKTGEEFWINFVLNPVANEKGWYTHWVAIERDVTKQKNDELLKTLMNEIGAIFNQPLAMPLLLDNLLKKLLIFGSFSMAEIWLLGADKNKMSLAAGYDSNDQAATFYQEKGHAPSFRKGEGLLGQTWELQTVQFWDRLDNNTDFARHDATIKADITNGYIVSLLSQNLTIGILVLYMGQGHKQDIELMKAFETLSSYLGAEVRRKQLEQELDQLFNFAPDIICTAGVDRYFKKVNPAMCNLLEYTEAEMLRSTISKFVHPDDRKKSAAAFDELKKESVLHYENRYITRTGKIKWLSWTATRGTEEGLLFCVGKDISDKKELERLLDNTTKLAQIGGWELDLITNRVYWSDITRKILSVDANFEPTLATGIFFCSAGEDQEKIKTLIDEAINDGKQFDVELQTVAPNGRHRWVRIVGTSEFKDGKCIRVFGSLQDVDERIRAQIAAKETLEEKNSILESIGDAFFAVDRNWTVTYWNRMAASVLRKPKKGIISRNFWDIFPDVVGSESYKRYHNAMATKKPVQFEDYYPPMDAWYDISVYPTANGLSVYLKDITERKSSEMRLIESEKRYSELFQLSPLPKLIFDQETLNFLDVNGTAVAFYGYSRDEFLQMTLDDLYPKDDIRLMNGLSETYGEKEGLTSIQTVRHRKKNGEIIQVDIRSNDICYNGRNARIVATNDVTESLHHLKAIEQQNETLREISWMQSHVLRAPLARIMGLVPLIAEADNATEDVRRMLEFLKLSAQELDNVIREINDKATQVY